MLLYYFFSLLHILSINNNFTVTSILHCTRTFETLYMAWLPRTHLHLRIFGFWHPMHHYIHHHYNWQLARVVVLFHSDTPRRLAHVLLFWLHDSDTPRRLPHVLLFWLHDSDIPRRLPHVFLQIYIYMYRLCHMCTSYIFNLMCNTLDKQTVTEEQYNICIVPQSTLRLIFYCMCRVMKDMNSSQLRVFMLSSIERMSA